MSGFKKVVITTLIIASVSIGIGAYIVYESGVGTGELAESINKLLDRGDISVNLGATKEVREEQSFSLEDKRNIEISVPIGEVKVTAYEGDEIRLLVEGKVPENYLNRYLEVKEERGALEISLYKGMGNINLSFFNRYDIRLYLEVPKEYQGNLDISNVSGDILVEGLHLRELTLENISGDLILESGSSEEVDFDVVSGQFISYGEVGSLSGNSISGKITANDVRNSADVESVSGSIQLTLSETIKDVEVESISGAVDLIFQGQEDLSYDLESVSGSITVETGEGINKGSRSLKRNVNNSPSVDVSTVSGTITLRY
jgi:hypothetical protein